MNAKSKWLTEKDGNIIIPKTLDTQVFDENGKSLDRRLKTAKDEQIIQLPKVDLSMIFSDLDYSTEEQLTGKRWIDGKPIYQKTLFIADSISNTEIQSSSNIENVDTVIELNGFCNWNDGDSYVFPMPYITRALDQAIQIFYKYSTKSIYIGTNLTITNVYATMKYTKTTDTASSPVAIPKVEAMHNYSTEEKVVGTWIDGKPLYEKTFRTTVNATGSIEYFSDVIVEDAESYFIEKAYYTENENGTGGISMIGSVNISSNYDYNITAFNLKTGRWWIIRGGSTYPYTTIIVRYTKTTDTATI